MHIQMENIHYKKIVQAILRDEGAFITSCHNKQQTYHQAKMRENRKSPDASLADKECLNHSPFLAITVSSESLR